METNCTSVINFRLSGNTMATFADKAMACQLLSSEDAFIGSLSAFDRALRMKSGSPATTAEMCRFAGNCGLDWTQEEIDLIVRSLEAVREGLSRYSAWLPPEVCFVKTTGEEEFQSAYTRANAVFLPLNKLDIPQVRMGMLIVHELFHVISRHNPALRESLYALIGFFPCGRIEKPDALKGRALTNPDALPIDYYIRLRYVNETLCSIPIVCFKDGGSDALPCKNIEECIEIKYMAIELCGDAGKPLERNGGPILIDPEYSTGIFGQAGRNTDNVIGPDEILADNFTLLVTGKKEVPSPHILAEIDGLLTAGH